MLLTGPSRSQRLLQIEFFAANIRNPNPRAAYVFAAVVRFADWCGCSLPGMVAARVV